MVERINHIDGQRKTPYNSTYPQLLSFCKQKP